MVQNVKISCASVNKIPNLRLLTTNVLKNVDIETRGSGNGQIQTHFRVLGLIPPVITRPLVCYEGFYACKQCAESKTLKVHPVGSKTLTQKIPPQNDAVPTLFGPAGDLGIPHVSTHCCLCIYDV